jgi:hypothetical protein
MHIPFPQIDQPAAGRALAAALAAEPAQLPEPLAPAAALRAALDAWVDEPAIEAAAHEGRVIARDRILTWQRENNGLPPEQTTPLELQRMGLSRLPDALGQLQNLQEADLSHNALAEVPACICAIPHLRVLYLSGNPLRSLAPAIGQLTGLTLMSVRGCGLEALPEEIGALTGLEVLDLSHNPLAQLPESFSRLTNLHTLSVGSTGINAQLVDSMGLPNLRQVGLDIGRARTVAAQGVGVEIQQANAQPAAPEAAVQDPEVVVHIDPVAAHRQQLLNDWHARLRAYANGQPDLAQQDLVLAFSELFAQMQSNGRLLARCIQIVTRAGNTDTGALMALNDMHEAAMVTISEQPGLDLGTVIELGIDQFVLNEVKGAALAMAAPERAAGRHDRAAEIMLATQSGICARLEELGLRAPLPTRNVRFDTRGIVIPDGQHERQSGMMLTIQDGAAIRRHLCLTPALAQCVNTTFAGDFNDLLPAYHLRQERLGARSDLNEGEVVEGDAAMQAVLEAIGATDEAAAADREIERGNGPLASGDYVRLLNNVMSELEAATAQLRQRLVAQAVEDHLGPA